MFADVKIQVTYTGYAMYDICVGENTYSVTGKFIAEGNKNILESCINGQPYKANVIINGNSIHVFTQVTKTMEASSPC